ncbi:MAG: 50S ribosomal protein L17 [Bacteroidales bacterium]|nr:50S ribosomal protein L17 [Bacteroidales bacterium]
MRHNRAINHLGRQSGHRKAMLANMASSLVLNKQIETTVMKAKALRMYVEPLITKSKEDTTHSRRVVFSYLKQKEAVSELFRVIAPKIADRPGGYTRIVRTGFRVGDAADMAIIQLVDFTDAAAAPEKETKRTSTRRGGKKSGTPEDGKSRKVNTPKAANENVTKAAPAARKVVAPRKSGNS